MSNAALLGASITAGLGLMGLVRPSAAASFTSIAPVGRTGISEIRATYGGFFLLAGLAALLGGEPAALRLLGWAWAGAAAGRAASAVVDGSREARNLAGIAFEAAVAALLLAG